MLHHAFDEMGGISKEEWIASYDKVTAAEGKEWRARGQRAWRDWVKSEERQGTESGETGGRECGDSSID